MLSTVEAFLDFFSVQYEGASLGENLRHSADVERAPGGKIVRIKAAPGE